MAELLEIRKPVVMPDIESYLSFDNPLDRVRTEIAWEIDCARNSMNDEDKLYHYRDAFVKVRLAYRIAYQMPQTEVRMIEKCRTWESCVKRYIWNVFSKYDNGELANQLFVAKLMSLSREPVQVRPQINLAIM